MLPVFQLGRFFSPFKIAGTRVIGGFRILRRSAQCTRRPNLKAARKKDTSIQMTYGATFRQHVCILFLARPLDLATMSDLRSGVLSQT